MLNFDFKKTSRKCSTNDRPFESGEVFFSALIDEGGELVRKDFASEAWDAPPEGCVGWWKSRMPNLEKGKVYWAPKDVLMAYFQHVYEQPAYADLAYVMAVLLVRKRILQMIETDESTEPPTMIVHHRKTKTDFPIAVQELSSHRISQIQNELAEQLFSDQPPESQDTQADD